MASRWTYRQIDVRYMDRQTEKQKTNKEANRQRTDIQTTARHRQTDRPTDRKTDRQTDYSRYIFISRDPLFLQLSQSKNQGRGCTQHPVSNVWLQYFSTRGKIFPDGFFNHLPVVLDFSDVYWNLSTLHVHFRNWYTFFRMNLCLFPRRAAFLRSGAPG